jgi:hypothetical protein
MKLVAIPEGKTKLKVFLGGTCNDSRWRDDLIKLLTIEYFNPVVDDWTEECYKEEIKQRETCDYVLYVLSPKMTGVYSVAEVVDDSNKRPNKTLFCIIDTDDNKSFDKGQLKSLDAVSKLVSKNGAVVLPDLKSVATYLNNQS